MSMPTKRDVGFYISLAACVLAVITAVVYTVYAAGNKTFYPVVLVMLLLGAAGAAARLFVCYPLLSFAACLCWSLAFGFLLQNRLMMFGDYMNGLPGLSGAGNIPELVIALLAAMAVCVIAEIVVCFRQRYC